MVECSDARNRISLGRRMRNGNKGVRAIPEIDKCAGSVVVGGEDKTCAYMVMITRRAIGGVHISMSKRCKEIL